MVESRRLAWPLIASNLTVPALGLVDTAMAGHLGAPAYIGAVALGANVLAIMYFLFGFLRMITTGLAAQAFGAGAIDDLSSVLLRALGLATLIGLFLTVSVVWIEPLAARFFAIDGLLRASFSSYVEIRAWGAPAALCTFVLIGWSLGHQNTWIPLLIMMVSNGCNAALDVLFVMAFGMGVEGIALATVMAEYLGLVWALYLVFGLWRRAHCRRPGWRALLEPGQMLRLLILNRDFFLRSLFMEIAFLSFMAISAWLGAAALAANAILFNFFVIAAYGLDGFAHATEAMVGKSVGARDQQQLDDAIRAGFWNALLLSGVITLVFVAGAVPLIYLMTDLEEVRAGAQSYQGYVWLLPLVSVWAFVYDGIFFGATRSKELRNGMAVSLVIFLAGAMILVPVFGNHGLWVMLLGYLAARGVVLGIIWNKIAATVIES